MDSKRTGYAVIARGAFPALGNFPGAPGPPGPPGPPGAPGPPGPSGIVQTLDATIAADVSIPGGTAFVTLLSVPIVTTGGTLRAWFSVGVRLNAGLPGNRFARFRMRVDGGAVTAITIDFLNFDARSSGSIVRRFAGLAAGAHTVDVQWSTNGMTTAAIEPASDPDGSHATLLVDET